MNELPKWMDPDYEPLDDPAVRGFDGFFDPPVYAIGRILLITVSVGAAMTVTTLLAQLLPG